MRNDDFKWSISISSQLINFNEFRWFISFEIKTLFGDYEIDFPIICVTVNLLWLSKTENLWIVFLNIDTCHIEKIVKR